VQLKVRKSKVSERAGQEILWRVSGDRAETSKSSASSATINHEFLRRYDWPYSSCAARTASHPRTTQCTLVSPDSLVALEGRRRTPGHCPWPPAQSSSAIAGFQEKCRSAERDRICGKRNAGTTHEALCVTEEAILEGCPCPWEAR
jgi:hypothetical protein